MEDSPKGSEQELNDRLAKKEKHTSDSFLESWIRFNRPDKFDSREEKKSPIKRILGKLKGLFLKDSVNPPALIHSPEQQVAADLSREQRHESINGHEPISENIVPGLYTPPNQENISKVTDSLVGKVGSEPEIALATLESYQPNPVQSRGQGPEQIGNIARRIEQDNTSNLTALELLSHRREAKTKKEIKALKKYAKSTKKEQEELTRRQEKFEKQLDANLKKSNKLDHLEAFPKVETVEHAPNLEITETPKEFRQKPETKEEKITTQETIKQFVESEASKRPEVVLERVEVAAAHDLPIEKLFEQRHESKDKTEDKSSFKIVTSNINGRSFPRSSKPETRFRTPNTVNNSPVTVKQQPLKQKVKNPTPLYTQAILGGFGAAVVLLGLILALLLLS